MDFHLSSQHKCPMTVIEHLVYANVVIVAYCFCIFCIVSFRSKRYVDNVHLDIISLKEARLRFLNVSLPNQELQRTEIVSTLR